MGEVYQAHDLKLGRDVALKLLSPALATSHEHLLRFEREARASSALNHPHICAVYDVGQAPEADGRPYLVMEHVDGEPLSAQLAREGRIPPMRFRIAASVRPSCRSRYGSSCPP